MTEDGGGTFRFQKLEIWKKAIKIGHKLLDVADILEARKLYRFAEQVRGERMIDRIQESGVRIQNDNWLHPKSKRNLASKEGSKLYAPCSKLMAPRPMLSAPS